MPLWYSKSIEKELIQLCPTAGRMRPSRRFCAAQVRCSLR